VLPEIEASGLRQVPNRTRARLVSDADKAVDHLVEVAFPACFILDLEGESLECLLAR
jgi:hypothetical protein